MSVSDCLICETGYTSRNYRTFCSEKTAHLKQALEELLEITIDSKARVCIPCHSKLVNYSKAKEQLKTNLERKCSQGKLKR